MRCHARSIARLAATFASALLAVAAVSRPVPAVAQCAV